MPRQSQRQHLLNEIDTATLDVARAWAEHAMADGEVSESDSSISEDSVIRTPSPVSPMSPDMSDSSDDSDMSMSVEIHLNFLRIIGSLAALWEEVEETRVLNHPAKPPMRAPQIQLLDQFAVHHPDLFRKKLHVSPEIFDDILNQISNHPVFHNQSNNPQLPIAVQLAIFLNRAGHYGNSISPQDVCQWAGVSVRSVINCTNRVMAALLAEHDNFISFPALDSVEAARA